MYNLFHERLSFLNIKHALVLCKYQEKIKIIQLATLINIRSTYPHQTNKFHGTGQFWRSYSRSDTQKLSYFVFFFCGIEQLATVFSKARIYFISLARWIHALRFSVLTSILTFSSQTHRPSKQILSFSCFDYNSTSIFKLLVRFLTHLSSLLLNYRSTLYEPTHNEIFSIFLVFVS